MPELELIGAAPSNYVWTCRIALAEKGVFERALLVEACADALSKQRDKVGKPEFHDAGMKVIHVLDDAATVWRTKIVVARRLATTFGKNHPVLEAKYWHRLLLAAEGADQAPVADDRYAPPVMPTFFVSTRPVCTR